jgi:hypothetical protein
MLLIVLDSRFRGNDDCGINENFPRSKPVTNLLHEQL